MWPKNVVQLYSFMKIWQPKFDEIEIGRANMKIKVKFGSGTINGV